MAYNVLFRPILDELMFVPCDSNTASEGPVPRVWGRIWLALVGQVACLKNKHIYLLSLFC